MKIAAERKRLAETGKKSKHWRRWGPYLSERAWGTVREDYSEDGSAWDYFPFSHSHLRAYRWSEDGIGGICDRRQMICFAVSMWNGRDQILKERIFGLNGVEGNHGEDAKEYYFYLDNTPTHSYMKFLYKYPQKEFPYKKLIEENCRRGKRESEFELLDTGVFDDDQYFDVFVEYAKKSDEDILIKIEVFNRGNQKAEIEILPTIWFRNTWSWNKDSEKPQLKEIFSSGDFKTIEASGIYFGKRYLYCAQPDELLFTENESNFQALYGVPNVCKFAKDGIADYIINKNQAAVNRQNTGTKTAARYSLSIKSGESKTLRLRLTDQEPAKIKNPFDKNFERVFEKRKTEADKFYSEIIPPDLSADEKNVMRQAFAGMLWSKQFYNYSVKDWLAGDTAHPPPSEKRKAGRNNQWTHLYNSDVISMPDKWEYPWYAAWDLAFHTLSLALVDTEFAKDQLLLMLREWYKHPNGQIPAYEWAFGDVNPPVHAWAALRVYQMEKKADGKGDRKFLARIFQKLLLNFTWWINRKDSDGMNVFEGGFLGLDNIGVFDRSHPLPIGGRLSQSDGTSWMAMYCLNMLAIALELAAEDDAYEDVASKFWEHFLYIAHAMNHHGVENSALWDEQEGFFYDVLHIRDVGNFPLRVRSMVGLIPLLAVETIGQEVLDKLPNFHRRMKWFIENRADLTAGITSVKSTDNGDVRLLAVAYEERLKPILQVMLDESEFLSDYGIRALSRIHKTIPFFLQVHDTEHRVEYEPAESSSYLFGGNSNWRGPVWFPVNYLLVESLRKFYEYFGEDLKVEFPTGSDNFLNLSQIADEISGRLTKIFLRDAKNGRPVFGKNEKFQTDPNWRDLILFYEYFHGDNGSGLGASHQTGWTGLIVNLLKTREDLN